MTGQMFVTLANRLPEIARLAGLVDAFGKAHGLSSEVIFNLNLSLDEVLTNVISYAYDDDAGHDVIVRAMLDGDRVLAEVDDDGCAFNPLEIAPPDIQAGLDRKGAGGLGVYLVRSLMDTVEYRPERERNVFTMRKRHAGGAHPGTTMSPVG
jgi:anti-sigma regulatory factor (Ser/Thr protein kinase)